MNLVPLPAGIGTTLDLFGRGVDFVPASQFAWMMPFSGSHYRREAA